MQVFSTPHFQVIPVKDILDQSITRQHPDLRKARQYKIYEEQFQGYVFQGHYILINYVAFIMKIQWIYTWSAIIKKTRGRDPQIKESQSLFGSGKYGTINAKIVDIHFLNFIVYNTSLVFFQFFDEIPHTVIFLIDRKNSYARAPLFKTKILLYSEDLSLLMK